MKFYLNEAEKEKLLALFNQHDINLDYIFNIIDALSKDYQLVSPKEQTALKGKSEFEFRKEAFANFEKQIGYRNEFIKKNMMWDTVILKADHFYANPYLKALEKVSFNENDWSLVKAKTEAYKIVPLQEEYPFGSNYALKMSLAMFDKDYVYPSIRLFDTEWMSLNPHEIRTMEVPIQLARGKVLTLGLGLGYFTFMAHLKEEVKEVHVVEMDVELINLFNKYLLPLFPHPEKIHIHKADAFHFIENIKDKDYDYIFSDLWHNVQDGVPAYLKLKKHFKDFTYTTCTYWIENSILVYLRFVVIEMMRNDYYDIHGDKYDELELFVRDKIKDYEVCNTYDIDDILNLKGLNKIYFE